jgi:hypothetical protein
MEYLVSLNRNIRNQGNKPTFVVCDRKEVLDLTQGTNKIGNLVCNWHESDEPSLSDNRYIYFQRANIAISRVTFKDPKRPNWKSYIDDLRENLETKLWSIYMIRDTDLAADQLQQGIILSYQNKCPARTTHSPRKVP